MHQWDQLNWLAATLPSSPNMEAFNLLHTDHPQIYLLCFFPTLIVRLPLPSIRFSISAPSLKKQIILRRHLCCRKTEEVRNFVLSRTMPCNANIELFFDVGLLRYWIQNARISISAKEANLFMKRWDYAKWSFNPLEVLSPWDQSFEKDISIARCIESNSTIPYFGLNFVILSWTWIWITIYPQVYCSSVNFG